MSKLDIGIYGIYWTFELGHWSFTVMVFRLPYSWLKEYVDVPKNPHDLARQLSLYGPSVEKVEAVRHEFTGVVVGEIVAIERHPNADKLQVALVQIGKGAPLRIVCGAPNIKVGQKVPLALVGATLPGGIKVSRREVRGVVSNGMLCSARELGIHDDHLGILVLHPQSKIGARLSDLGNLHDYILEVEPTTNRPDISSVIGVAREVSAITGKPLKRSAKKAETKTPFSCSLTIKVLDRKLCPRFTAVLIKNISVGASPWWIQERLARAGIRPINAVVDVTNYVLLEYGQPLHAFDADKLGTTIIVRPAKTGERLLALDGRTYNLKSGHLVVANQKKPVSIAGVMGGEDTAVTDKTTNIVLECANFNAVSIRKTSRDLQLFSESSRLFEKGLSEESPSAVLVRAIELVQKISGGERSKIIDSRVGSYQPPTIRFPLSRLDRILGVSVPWPAVKRLLTRLGFTVKGSGRTLKVVVPYWRDHDVRDPEDLVEEVARLYGYHRFTPLLPEISTSNLMSKSQGLSKNSYYAKFRFSRKGVMGFSSVLPSAVHAAEGRAKDFLAEDEIRRRLIAMGFVEVLNYSFIRESWLTAMSYPVKSALKLFNPLTSDLTYLRPSLIPSLSSVMETNIAHRDEIKIFEIAKVYRPGKSSGSGLDSYREETLFVSGVIVNIGATKEELYRTVKGVTEELLNIVGRGANMEATTHPGLPFAAGLSVAVGLDGVEERGALGILDPAFLQGFGIKQFVAAFELPLSLFLNTIGRASYKPIPKFPAVKRDLALAVGAGVRYNDLVQTMRALTPLLESVELFDIYRDQNLGRDRQSYAMHLIYRASDRTLSSAEVEAAEAKVLEILQQKFGVKLR